MQKNKVKISCTLDEETYKQLTHKARYNQMSLSDFVNESLKLLNSDRSLFDRVSDTQNKKSMKTL